MPTPTFNSSRKKRIDVLEISSPAESTMTISGSPIFPTKIKLRDRENRNQGRNKGNFKAFLQMNNSSNSWMLLDELEELIFLQQTIASIAYLNFIFYYFFLAAHSSQPQLPPFAEVRDGRFTSQFSKKKKTPITVLHDSARPESPAAPRLCTPFKNQCAQ